MTNPSLTHDTDGEVTPSLADLEQALAGGGDIAIRHDTHPGVRDHRRWVVDIHPWPGSAADGHGTGPTLPEASATALADLASEVAP